MRTMENAVSSSRTAYLGANRDHHGGSVGAFERPCCSVSVRRVAGASPNSSRQRGWEEGSPQRLRATAAGAPRKHGGSPSAPVLGLGLQFFSSYPNPFAQDSKADLYIFH